MATCAFDTGFDSGFQICTDEEAPTPDTRTLVGVPGKVRRRPQVTEVSGVLYISVIGAGKLTGDACLRSTLDQPIDISANLVSDALRVLVAAIRSGSEAYLSGERALVSDLPVAWASVGSTVREIAVSDAQGLRYFLNARMTRDTEISARLAVRSGNESVLTKQRTNRIALAAVIAYLTS